MQARTPLGGFFADPGKYEFYSCEQLVPQRAFHANREQQLKLLMDKARQGTGGAPISLVPLGPSRPAALAPRAATQPPRRRVRQATPAVRW
jgi:hypothetical protein